MIAVGSGRREDVRPDGGDDVVGAATVAVARRVAAAEELPVGRPAADVANLLHERIAFDIRIERHRRAEL